MVSHFDEAFHVMVNEEGVARSFLITPVYHKINTEATFAVSAEGKDLGKLKRQTPGRWIWAEGKADEALAGEIGLRIDNHFN